MNTHNTVECPFCNGKPVAYYKLNIDTRETVECTENEYYSLKDDEDEAYDAGDAYCRYEEVPCVFCNGEGRMRADDPLIEEKYIPDPDERWERRLELCNA